MRVGSLSVWAFIAIQNKPEYPDRIYEAKKKLHGFELLVFQMHRSGGDVLCIRKRKVIQWFNVSCSRWTWDQTIQRYQMQVVSEEVIPLWRKKPFCSLTYVAPGRLVYCCCMTCGAWKLLSNLVVVMVTRGRWLNESELVGVLRSVSTHLYVILNVSGRVYINVWDGA